MTNVSYNELVGEFEAEMELEEKADALQSQIKMIKADIAERQKSFAQEKILQKHTSIGKKYANRTTLLLHLKTSLLCVYLLTAELQQKTQVRLK